MQLEERPGSSTARPGSPSRGAFKALAHFWEAAWAAQRDRWILWLPVAVIAGAAWWLTAQHEPDWRLAPALFVGAAVLSCLAAFWPSARPDGPIEALRRLMAGALALAAAFGLGASAAQWRAFSAVAPIFDSGGEPVGVDGWVVAVEPGETRPRLRLLVREIEGVSGPPRFVRVAVSAHGVLSPGRGAHCFAVLSPPQGPLVPGGYDFARRAYFEKLGATGFAYGRCRPRALDPPEGRLDRLMLRVAAWRADLAAAILETAPGRGGAVASALVTGDRGAIDRDTNETLRDSGLGHLLSVSGLHMGVVGGLVFASVSLALALIPPIALRFPIKKIAALSGLIALSLYLVVSGASVPAIRAYVMAGVAFGAILIDRPGISMRGLALSALIICLAFPESVVEPGFQMSFAATLALIALFEAWKRPASEPALPTPGPIIGALQWASRGIMGVIGVSLVAGLATDPFAIYHFQRFSIYALASNLAVAPLMSFLVAPAAALAAVLAPFGWHEPALHVMAWALDLVTAIGEAFGHRPEAVRALAKPSDIAFLLCVGALLWAALWRGALRWGGVILLAASLVLYFAAPRPELAFDAELRAVYARAEAEQGENWRLMRGAGRSTFARDRIGAMLGLAPGRIAHLPPPRDCTEAHCIWRGESGHAYALARAPEAFAQICLEGAVILTIAPPPPDFTSRCAPALLIDLAETGHQGGGFVTSADGALRLRRASPALPDRPWTRASTRADASDQE